MDMRSEELHGACPSSMYAPLSCYYNATVTALSYCVTPLRFDPSSMLQYFDHFST